MNEGWAGDPPGTPGGQAITLGRYPPSGETGQRSQRRTARPGRARWARWAWPAAVAAAGAGLFLCYLRLSETFPVGSDGASNALEAWDMLHGNWLLRGWTLTDVSFYTTELPEYMAVELARGLNPGVVHVASAVSYALLVILAGLLARGRAGGREGRARALIASGIMLAPQPGNGIHLLLSQPDHAGTQVPVLVVFLVLDRAPRRWYTPAAIGLLLAWVVIADQVAILEAAIPLVIVGALRALMAIARHRQRLASQWFELSLVAAAVAGSGLAELTVRLIRRLGGFALLPVESGLSKASQLPAHLRLAVQGVLNLFGADVIGSPPGAQTVIAWLHMIGVTLALAGFLAAFRGLFRRAGLLPAVLATGIVVNVACYVASVIPSTPWDTREIVAVLPFGAVLAGRMLAGPMLAGPPRARFAPVLAAALACSAFALAYGLAQPRAASTEQSLAGWLRAHHLTTGLGTYTEDNVTTLDSGGRVRMLTVSWEKSGGVPRVYQSSASWYDPRTHYANFIATNSAEGRVSLIPRRDILGLAGPPARTYRYQTFTIMVWRRNLLTALGSPPSVKPGDIP